MKHFLPIALGALLGSLAGTVAAKLPPLSDEAKAKAAETAAKAAWSDKVANFQLCKSMDRVAAAYRADAKKAGKDAPPPADTPPCTDPGPFVGQGDGKPPIESAGAHSPAKTAASPPSTTTPAAASAPMTAVKAGTAPKK